MAPSELIWPESREEKKAKKERALYAALEINPLETAYNAIQKQFAEDIIALKKLRIEMLDTMNEPLEVVCEKLPPAEDLEIKVAVLRRYIRKKGLHLEDGRRRKPFWLNLDVWYESKARKLGPEFKTPWWGRYLDDTFDREYDLFVPSIERPLYRWTPMSMAGLVR
ncbi:hypothetical protein B0H17DRAFT_1144647 [Mycena rosella]|uniref:Uncharacterized protein n=1 Tax=Mycena rosella TaxID=1033263 RepID=A0AAD7CSV8_MYCRO|nr:hypothetical protein B0H17DRAFT_1144647 [Mycena rosella]